MADKIMHSLLYDDHPVPKRSRALKERLKVPVTITLVLIVIAGLAYKFANFREERSVRQFIANIESGQYEAAFKDWDGNPQYTLMDFLEDWGKDGYYTKGMQQARVVGSNGKGSWVLVYLEVDTMKYPVALQVNKETLRVSFSPINPCKYAVTWTSMLRCSLTEQ